MGPMRSVYKTWDIQYTVKQRQLFTGELVTHLGSTFPDHKVTEASRVLSPMDSRNNYVEVQMSSLTDHFTEFVSTEYRACERGVFAYNAFNTSN